MIIVPELPEFFDGPVFISFPRAGYSSLSSALYPTRQPALPRICFRTIFATSPPSASALGDGLSPGETYVLSIFFLSKPVCSFLLLESRLSTSVINYNSRLIASSLITRFSRGIQVMQSHSWEDLKALLNRPIV